ncbi:hypothetical protein Tco_0796021 [Tanacetum coccineum]
MVHKKKPCLSLLSSNDEGKAPSVVDGSDLSSKFDTAHNLYQEEGVTATQFNDNIIPEDSRHSVSSPSRESTLCFATNLNKSMEPSCYEDAMCDTNWIDAMNNKIEALNRSNT